MLDWTTQLYICVLLLTSRKMMNLSLFSFYWCHLVWKMPEETATRRTDLKILKGVRVAGCGYGFLVVTLVKHELDGRARTLEERARDIFGFYTIHRKTKL
ncbi:hypothetical protein NDU88_006848 [Pleurodeles waltl]|uniref:Uncharacterized protein n=1 Tax=Pleurodeles waltl TaxID=8319 RepID=A0AAV7QLY6_PLEWA|nr:hypothetical protein NDU88_006848 [Pleurodeles waltl]